MGFGSISGMITSLKNNKRQRVSVFENTKYLKGVKFKPGKIDKKASPELLQEIRTSLKRRNRRIQLVMVIIILITLALFAWLMIIFE